MNPSTAIRSLPWWTLLTGAFAAAIWFVPEVSGQLIYDREKILGGQLWRLLTGHWVHFSQRHLWLNLIVLLPCGLWLERRSPAVMHRIILFTPATVSLALFIFAPAMVRYAGLSGVASAALVALATLGLRTEPRARLVWLGVLVLFATALTTESCGRKPLYPGLTSQGINSAPLAHFTGALAGACAAIWPARKRHLPPTNE